MNLDDFLLDEVPMGLFGDEFFEDPRLERYSRKVKENLNSISAYDLDYVLSFIDQLDNYNVKVGSRIVQSVAKQFDKAEGEEKFSRARTIRDLGKKVSTLSEEGLFAVLDKMDSITNSQRFSALGEYVSRAAVEIGENVENPLFGKALSTLSSAAAKKSSRINPKRVFLDSLESEVVREYVRSGASQKISYHLLPDDKKELFESGSDREGYFRLISKVPGAVNLSNEQFEEVAISCLEAETVYKTKIGKIEEWFKELSNPQTWYLRKKKEETLEARGELDFSLYGFLKKHLRIGKPEEASFYFHAYQEFGKEAVGFSKKVLGTLAVKSSSEEESVKVLKHLKSKKHLFYRNTWKNKLRQYVEDSFESSLEDCVTEFCESLITKQSEEDTLRDRKRTYSTLTRKIRQAPLNVNDYLLGLEEPVLGALHQWKGRFKEILLGMGTDLDDVNSLSYECPASFAVALYSRGLNTSEIKGVLSGLSEKARNDLNGFSDNKIQAITENPDNLEEMIGRYSSLNTKQMRVVEIARKYELGDSIDYALSLSEEQTEVLSRLNNTSIKAFVANDKETLLIFKNIDDIDSFRPYLMNPTHAGNVIRSYNGLPDEEFNLFYRETGIEVTEGNLKPLVDKYAKMSVNDRERMKIYLNSNQKIVLELSKELDSKKLLLACGMIYDRYSKEVALEFVRDDSLTEKIEVVQERYRRNWLNFLPKVEERGAFFELPLVDFYRAADVLDHVRPHGGEEKFFESFNVILGRGEVKPWTKEILKRIENVGKGGTNYRVLEVAA